MHIPYTVAFWMQVFTLRVSPNSLTSPTAACLVLSSDLANSFAYSETSFLIFFLSINLNYLFGKQPTLDILHMLGWEHKYQRVYINLRSLKMDLDCHAFLKHTLRLQYVCLVCTRKEPPWGGWPPPRVNFFFSRCWGEVCTVQAGAGSIVHHVLFIRRPGRSRW